MPASPLTPTFSTTHVRQASYESSCLILILVLALQVKTPAWSFQHMKNLTHLSPTFGIKTFLSILSWILITSWVEFLSDWICEMCALLTSSHCCSPGYVSLLVSWDSDVVQGPFLLVSNLARVHEHLCNIDSGSIVCPVHIGWDKNCQMLILICSAKDTVMSCLGSLWKKNDEKDKCSRTKILPQYLLPFCLRIWMEMAAILKTTTFAKTGF